MGFVDELIENISIHAPRAGGDHGGFLSVV